jgi:hypothetical protein
MKAELGQTLAMVAAAAEDAAQPWWIIGSTAMALHGIPSAWLGTGAAHAKDVDLMMSAADAERLLRRVGGELRDAGGSDRFRSAVFGLWRAPPIPVEVFGGFSLAERGGWREVTLATRQAVTVAGARVFVPSREELVRLLRAFGRPKDLERARVLELGV